MLHFNKEKLNNWKITFDIHYKKLNIISIDEITFCGWLQFQPLPLLRHIVHLWVYKFDLHFTLHRIHHALFYKCLLSFIYYRELEKRERLLLIECNAPTLLVHIYSWFFDFSALYSFYLEKV